jgi:acyl dehydratase
MDTPAHQRRRNLTPPARSHQARITVRSTRARSPPALQPFSKREDDGMPDGGAMHRHQPTVGQTARRTRTVSARDIELFTELTGDRNPLHYDEALARDSRFGALIVQGGVTSGLLNAVVAEDLPGPGSVFLHVDWSFTAPVRPGDHITAEVEVLDSRADKPITKLRTTITRADGVVVLHGTALVWREDLEGRAGR